MVTTAYQLFHYKNIAAHLSDVTAVIEVREQEFDLTDEVIAEHLPGVPVETVSRERLKDLDGRFEAVVCQTPILPLEFFDSSYVVAQQYSLAKENYQYGVWRAQADLNLMYGDYSVGKVEGFSRAVAVGNPLLDPYFAQRASSRGRPSDRRSRILYMPTYGSLSSLRSVLPVLRELDADVTVKLHHAETVELDSLPPHIRVVGAKEDPCVLLAEHDGVLSDFSGAAFDALYAGVPTVVCRTVDPRSKDLTRLSESERGSTLTSLAADWQPDRGAAALRDAFDTARGLQDGDEYEAFRKQFFINAGTAGEACAAKIRELIETGTTDHFGSDQVRSTVRRYITSNRQLKAKPGRSGASSPARPQPPTRRAIRRVRQIAARSDRLVRLARRVRRGVRQRRRPEIAVNATVALGAAPASRREAVLRLLTPFLAKGGLELARDNDRPGSDVAALAGDKRRLHRVLMAAAAEHPELMVRVGNQWQLVDTLPLSKLSFHDVTYADWLEIGTTAEHSRYTIGAMGYLTVLFVEHQKERNRYLAQKKVANRVDWTPLFTQSASESTEATGPIRVSGEVITHAAGPVDVVYTWVDSADADWQRNRAEHDSQTANVSAANPERFMDRQELRYSLRALELFAPFVRDIYIVTADQHPSWLAKDHPRVRVVSHREIFPDESMLPTFNSHAIEACLHRIPGLSENFLYFNDDVFVGQEVDVSDFFTIAGQAKVRLSPSQYIYQGEPEAGAIPTDWAAYNSLQLIAKDFDITFDRRVKHVPLVLKKSVLAEIEQRFPHEFERTRAARFRSSSDIAVPSMFAQYYGMASGQAVEWPGARNEYVYLDTGRADSLDRFQGILHRPPKFFCLNTTRHTEVDLPTQARNLSKFFVSAFPDPAGWEVP